MTPKFCEKCNRLLPDGGCRIYKRCFSWRSWFRKASDGIQKGAEIARESETKEKQNE